MQQEPTKQDILDAINSFATSVEIRFQSLETRVGGIENKMVTKDYLDEKLYDLRGDLISMTRKEDVKLGTLVRILEKRKVINQSEARQIRELEPFAQ